MKCPICNTKELSGKQKYCSGACRVKASRLGVKDDQVVTQHFQKHITLPDGSKDVLDYTGVRSETPEEWLARRVEETGSAKWQWVKTGNPPGSQPDIKVPQKRELADIDQALLFRGQWGKRGLESKP